jgi:hypothetical protein
MVLFISGNMKRRPGKFVITHSWVRGGRGNILCIWLEDEAQEGDVSRLFFGEGEGHAVVQPVCDLEVRRAPLCYAVCFVLGLSTGYHDQ